MIPITYELFHKAAMKIRQDKGVNIGWNTETNGEGIFNWYQPETFETNMLFIDELNLLLGHKPTAKRKARPVQPLAPVKTIANVKLAKPVSAGFSQDAEPVKTPSRSKKKSQPTDESVELNRNIWEAYDQAYMKKYGVHPSRNATVNKQIDLFGKRLGQDAIEVIKSYLDHKDGFYIKKTHSFGLALKDAETLRTQWMRGKQVTSNDVRQFENQDHFQSQMDRVQAGEL